MKQNASINNILSLIERVEGKKLIKEGIDIDYDNLTVAYNPSHQDNVDTSLENNPTISNEYGDGIAVYSLLMRKGNDIMDGNPLLYAFKGENGWHFKTDDDKNAILNQVNNIAQKFADMFPLGFTILIPSGNHLNRMIGEIVKSKGKDVLIVDDVLTKITTEEVMDIVLEKGSPFHIYYQNTMNTALRQLKMYLDKMDEERGGYFTRHYVRDAKMRDVLNKTLKLTNDAVARYSKSIDGKDVLLIDDSISRGQTIKEACNILMENYVPKSITVLTLFSKLYK